MIFQIWKIEKWSRSRDNSNKNYRIGIYMGELSNYKEIRKESLVTFLEITKLTLKEINLVTRIVVTPAKSLTILTKSLKVIILL